MLPVTSGGRMPVLTDCQVDAVYHYAPLHYLIFIARSQSILNRSFPSEGRLYVQSSEVDVAWLLDAVRGFGSYAQLTIDAQPRILRAKACCWLPSHRSQHSCSEIDALRSSLCRFNVAMTLRLKHEGKDGFPESKPTAVTMHGLQIPIARTEADKSTMLKKHLQENTMIEVLVHGDFGLSSETSIICFAKRGSTIARQILSSLDCKWS